MIGGGRAALAFVTALTAAGCTTMKPREAFREVQNLVKGRTSAEVVWNQGTPEDAQVEQRVKDLLQQPLTDDTAVQIALLNNRNLQATYEDLGIAQADLVQAGLLKNPVLSVERRFSGKALEVDVVQEFVDLLFLPLRRRVAGTAFEAASLRVTQAVLDLAADARAAFYMLQGAEQLVEMRRAVLESAEVSAELAQRMYAAGNLTNLDWRMEQRLARQTRLDLATAEEEVIQHRERLNTLMGLWGVDAIWTVAARLPELPEVEITGPGLQSIAVSQRLDLAAARQDIVTAAESLGLTRALRFVSSVEGAAHYEREPEGGYSVGPSVHVALPIFDWGQAAVPRERALMRQKEQRYIALAVEIRSQVRAAYSRMRSARDRAEFYRQTVLPLQVEILKQAQLHYNAMQLGPLHLFQLKQAEIEAGREYIEALRDFWIARAELEQALGGRIKEGDESTSTMLKGHEGLPAPEPAAPNAQQHHHTEDE